PYGLQVSGPVEDGPGYTGHVEDVATGLTYMQQRYYDPGIGMFLSVDPVTAYSNPVGQFNRYRYANGNPYMYTDPDGRSGEFVVLRGVLSIAAADAATPDPTDVAAPAKAAVYTTAIAATAIGGTIVWVTNQASESTSPEIPEGLVGEQDGKGGSKKGRHNSGPLSEENGGTGSAEKDFEKLTGGNSGPAPEGSRLPEGSRVGENGIVLRPSENGPRIDIPSNGDKPRETLHYPPESKL
ncbi:MAG TPA: RHS repeat-associated core domain-containing protein, partial [Gammaproteobacteria bacterium]